jgi:hypothetical protein
MYMDSVCTSVRRRKRQRATMDIRPIRTAADYTAALNEVSAPMADDPELETPAGAEPRPDCWFHFGASRIAPPSRVTSPLSISFSTMSPAWHSRRACRSLEGVRRARATLVQPS